MILLPGWGFTWQIFFKPGVFTGLDFDFLLPQRPVTPKTASSLCTLLHTLVQQKRRIVILGWSLGGLPAIEAFKSFESDIEKLLLVAVRKEYTANEIETQRNLVKIDHSKALSDFYRRCFLGQKKDLRWFKSEIMGYCLRACSMHCLLEGLDYLLQPIETACLDNEKVCLVYGSKDALIPKDLRIRLKRACTSVLPNTGHAPFLSSAFEAVFAQTLQSKR